jgi:acylpyruvate hydrolase
MKVVRFSRNGDVPRLGQLDNRSNVLDLAASCAAYLRWRGDGRADDIAAALFPASTRAFLHGLAAAGDMLARMQEAAAAGHVEPVTHPLAAVRLHAPIADPGKFICIGLNYRDHAEEANLKPPPYPPLFAKFANAILDPGQAILRPRGESTLDWEVELGVVIGKTARHVTQARALDHVFGYAIVNDASARQFQMQTSQWGAGKMGDTLAPVGPWIADRSEIPDPHVLQLRTWVNGALMQDGNTRNLIFDVNYLIEYLSNIMTLDPGDLIATGTPAGVGFTRKPPVTLQPGDTMRLEITGLGTLENTVKDA